MRPLFNRQSLWVWPIFGGAGASFGYWLEGVGARQKAILGERRDRLLEKRTRQAQREAAGLSVGSEGVGGGREDVGGIGEVVNA